MSFLCAVLVVLIGASGAIAASTLVNRFVSLAARRRHHEVGAQVFQLIGVMFSVLLAFVFNQVWSQYNTAAQAISAECAALHGAAMLASAMPRELGRPINEKILLYSQAVIEREWPRMRKERRSSDAASALRAAIDTAAQVSADAASDLANRSQIVTLLAQAHDARETRTFQLAFGLPSAMWTVLLVIALTLVAFVVVSGTEPPATVLLAGAFAAAIIMVLVLVRMLDYPFEGALALDSSDFEKLSGQVAALLAQR